MLAGCHTETSRPESTPPQPSRRSPPSKGRSSAMIRLRWRLPSTAPAPGHCPRRQKHLTSRVPLAPNAPDSYVVKKGDTLLGHRQGISARSYTHCQRHGAVLGVASQLHRMRDEEQAGRSMASTSIPAIPTYHCFILNTRQSHHFDGIQLLGPIISGKHGASVFGLTGQCTMNLKEGFDSHLPRTIGDKRNFSFPSRTFSQLITVLQCGSAIVLHFRPTQVRTDMRHQDTVSCGWLPHRLTLEFIPGIGKQSCTQTLVPRMRGTRSLGSTPITHCQECFFLPMVYLK